MSEKPYTPPEFESQAFHCPHCGVYAQQRWTHVSYISNGFSREYSIRVSMCLYCMHECLWVNEKLCFPDVSAYPPANVDMPEAVKEIYNEAAAVANKSARAAAALLRLALQTLCRELGAPKGQLQKEIDFLVAERDLPRRIVQAMDIVRLAGNDSVHPDKVAIDIDSDPNIVDALFRFINLIVDHVISRPKADDTAINAIDAFIPDSKKRKNMPPE